MFHVSIQAQLVNQRALGGQHWLSSSFLRSSQASLI